MLEVEGEVEADEATGVRDGDEMELDRPEEEGILSVDEGVDSVRIKIKSLKRSKIPR